MNKFQRVSVNICYRFLFFSARNNFPLILFLPMLSQMAKLKAYRRVCSWFYALSPSPSHANCP
jgi:hypothetical protein